MKTTKLCNFLIVITVLIFGPICKAQEQKLEDYKKRGLDERNYYDESGKPRPDLFRNSLTEFAKTKNGQTSSLGALTTWDQVGPAPANVNASLAGNGQLPGPNAGAVIDIAIDPRGKKDSIIYLASNSGGVWKSTDGGNNWSPKTDFLPTLSVGAVALDNSNPDRVYLGTGNIFNNGYIMSIGIYKSEDGGETWHKTTDNTTLVGKPINKMSIPAPNVILVATRQGFYRSQDNGNTFTEISIGSTTGEYITDLDVQEGNPNNVWVSINGKGIYASTDGGASFGTNLWGTGHGAVPTVGYSFVSMGVSSDGQTLYANAAISPGITLRKSTDGGNTWKDLTASVSSPLLKSGYSWRDINACQCGYDQTMGVDPTDASRVYMGFQDMWISEDGGATWNNATLSFAPSKTSYTELMHVDHHALVFSPTTHRTSGNPVGLWVGNDGGTWSTGDNGRSWNCQNEGERASTSLATHLFRYIDTGRGTNNNRWTYGGTQDNGTSVGNPNNQKSGWSLEWNEWTGGDGNYAAVNWKNPLIAYGNWGVTRNGGVSWNWWSASCASAGFGASIAQAEHGANSNTVYFGGSCDSTNSSNQAVKWVPTLFTTPNDGNTFTQAWQPAGKTSDRISSIAVTPADTSLLFATVSSIYWNGGGSAYKLVKNGSTYTSEPLTIPGINGQAPVIAISPSNSKLVAAVYAGYSGTQWPSPSKHVFFSQDGGNTWRDISGTIDGARVSDMPIYDVAFDSNTDPQSILVSSDFGVFRTFDFGLSWHTMGKNLPNVHTVSLAMDATVDPSVIKAGTFGRSTWEDTLTIGNTVFGPYSLKPLNVGLMTWSNKSNESMKLYWIPTGTSGEQLFGTLAPGESQAYGPTYFIKTYVVRDQSDNIVFVYMPRDDSDQQVTISQVMLDQAKSNALKSFPGLRSLPNKGQTVSNFAVQNNSNGIVHINYIDGAGFSSGIGTLNPSEANAIKFVYIGGAFTITDAYGRLLAVYTASASSNQKVTITQQIVDFWGY